MYYTQKLSGSGGPPVPDALALVTSPEPADQEDTSILDDTVPLELQPEILHAVHKCINMWTTLRSALRG